MSLIVTKVLFFLLIILSPSLISCQQLNSPSIKTDAIALLSFKKTIKKDPNKVLSDWNLSRDPCTWHGVTCNKIPQRVTSLDLAQSNLAGPVSFEPFSSMDSLTSLNLSANTLALNATALANLPPGLTRLELSFSGIAGHLPEDLFAARPSLEYVDLAFNNLTGQLPENLLLRVERLAYLDMSYNDIAGSAAGLRIEACGSLARIDWSGNRIAGPLPDSLSNCTGLTELILPENLFSGEIPRSYGLLTSLQRLDLSHNRLAGWVPPELGGACGSLVELKLSNNNLTGTVPFSFSSCSRLQTLDLSQNNLTGPFPNSILQNLTSLETILLSANKISGEFPSSISYCKKLRVVDFSSNMLSGPIPPSICTDDSSLEELRAPDNMLTGQISAQLSKCSQLKIVDFSLNYINGSIPPEIGDLGNLEQLIAWYNGIEGQIPPELGRCTKLKNLILNNNRLTGEIPRELFDSSDIEWISLTSNGLTGEIPREFGQLTRLAVLQLGNNSLTGQIPRELGNCSSLVWLDLDGNQLIGEIPPRLGRHAGAKSLPGILSGNTLVFVRNVGNSCRGVGGLLEFYGIRPERLLQIPSLKNCDFTRMYSGPVLSQFTRYQTLEYLDLSYNQLRGKIPDEFGEMIALQVLVLSHNELSGEIPATFGQLKNLGVFDASNNRLQGHIPDSFSNLSFLVQIDLSSNELTGQIPSRGQLSTLPATQFANNPGLCGVPLPECGYGQNPQSPDPGRRQPGSGKGAKSWANGVIMGILISVALICLLVVWSIAVKARRREAEDAKMLNKLRASQAATTWRIEKEKEPLSINVATFQRQLRKLKFSQLVEATNGFSGSSLIGSGGFGEVFRATLKDGSCVAIKKLVRLSCQGDREFTAEMETLGKIKHRNLVPLLGYCKVGEERLLVYEFMRHGSLEEMLHVKSRAHEGRRRILTWEERKKIARGAAKGLCFLHHNCIPHIIHRDMKSSNVLLDQEMEARVSDFGMARLISALDTHLSVSTLAGTPGYVPPEYYQSFRCTAKGDVYSLGVILLEIVTGKRPTDKEDFGDTNLVGWVKGKVREGRSVEVFDHELFDEITEREEGGDYGGEVKVKEMVRYLEVVMRCVDDFPSKRPNMLQVVAMLREIEGHGGASSSSG